MITLNNSDARRHLNLPVLPRTSGEGDSESAVHSQHGRERLDSDVSAQITVISIPLTMPIAQTRVSP